MSRRYIQIEDLRHNDNLKYCIPNKKSVHVNKDDLIIAWDGANAGTIGVGLEGVIGSTLVLTDKGYFKIKDLVGNKTKVWNGREFSVSVASETG